MATEDTAKITSGLGLTKEEVRRYYARADVQKKLLPYLKNKDLLVGQSSAPDHLIYRRYDKDKPIRVSTPAELEWYGSRRYTEFHPVIGKTTREVWVDLDPGKGIKEKDLKETTRLVDHMLKSMPEIRSTSVAYSGGRGYYVRGLLEKETDTAKARHFLQKQLAAMEGKDKLFTGGEVTFQPPGKNQIRLDLSTLHDKGSIRAPYALHSETGLMSVPVSIKDLPGFDPQRDANPRKLAAEKEFAPGISMSRATHALPELKDKTWTMAVQAHDARKAGMHWDLRLVDPDTTHAHSWAVPKSKLPSPGDKPILAVRTPTHTADYALHYGVNGPKAIHEGYGKGMVEMVHKEPVNVLSSQPDKIKFERTINGLPQQYVLFQTKGHSWLLKNTTKPSKEASMAGMNPFQQGQYAALYKLGLADNAGTESNSNGGVVSEKPSISETAMPIETDDEQLPAGQLAAALSQISEPTSNSEARMSPGENTEGHLNRNTVWSEPHPIPNDMTQGASPVMPGRF